MMEFTYDGLVRQGFGFYNPNVVLAGELLLLFAGLTAFLVRSGFRRDGKKRSRLGGGIRGIAMAAGCCAVVVGLLFCTASSGPEVVDEFIVSRAEEQCPALVLYGGDWNLSQVRRFLPETGYRLPVRPWDGEAPHFTAERIMLFGDCASYASDYPNATVTLVAPPEHFRLPPNVSMLWLRSFEDHESLLRQVKARTICVDLF